MAFNPGAWIKAHKGATIALGIGGGAAGYEIWKNRGNASSAAGPGTQYNPALPAQFRGQTDPSYGALQAEIAALERQIARLSKAREKRRHHPGPHPIPPVWLQRKKGSGGAAGRRKRHRPPRRQPPPWHAPRPPAPRRRSR